MNFQKLTDFLDYLPQEGIPACDMSVWKDHKEIYRHSAGMGRLPDPDAVAYIYSCTKIMTVCAAMTLFEQGKFVMNTPVSDFLPEYAHLRVRTPDGSSVPAKKPVTMLQLFTMTSGWAYDFDDPAIAELKEKTNGRCSTREVARAVAKIPLHFEPGERFLYGFSHDILAAVIEVITGEKFSDYVRRVILDPLGMKSTTFTPTPEIMARMEPQFTYKAATGETLPDTVHNVYILGPDHESGGAGAISCVDDMAKLADCLTHFGMGAAGKRILSRQTVEYMRAPKLTEAQRSTFIWKHLGTSYTYGIGMRVCDNLQGGCMLPIGEFGWGGAAGALFVCSPELGISAYYAQHMRPNREEYVHPRLMNILAACATEE